MSKELVRMDNIIKDYGRVRALDGVTFRVYENEIVGLLGDNGAGKSTLIKVLSGAVPPTSGDIFIKGKKVEIRSTTDAIANGIETIYQDSALVTQLSIARNLFLGREPMTGPGFLNRMDHGRDGPGGARACCGRSASPRTSRPRRRSARCRAASARRWRSRAPCISTAT